MQIQYPHYQNLNICREFPDVQRLETPYASTAESLCLISGWGTKILQVTRFNQK